MLNTEYRNMNAEKTLTNIAFGECFNGIKPLRNSVFLACLPARQVLYSIVFAAFLLSSHITTAQSLESLYTGLENATSISVAANSIYVVEQGKDRVLKLDLSGNVLDTFGGRGSGEYQLSKPVDVDATNGLKIFVTDQNNRRIQVFDRRGQFLSSISERASFENSRNYEPDQLSVTDSGEIYFWDAGSRLIRRFDVDYNFEDEFRISTEIRSFDDMWVSLTEILILDLKSQTIHRLFPNGGFAGFYPAEGVKAFHVNDEGFWRAFENRVELEQDDKTTLSITYNEVLQPVDMHVLSGKIFILTSEELYKLEIK